MSIEKKEWHNQISVFEAPSYLVFYWNDSENMNEIQLFYDLLSNHVNLIGQI